MKQLLGSESSFAEFVAALEHRAAQPGRSLRLNPLRGADRAKLEVLGVKLTKQIPWLNRGFFADLSALSPLETHPLLGAGLVYLQEAGAMEAVSMLDVQPGQ